jgi:hypothetical protein
MQVIWGAVKTQYDGTADDGDATDGPPGNYSGPKPGRCKDNNAVASSGGQNGIVTAANSATGDLSGTANPAVGSKATALATATSMNKVEQEFTVRLGFWDWIAALFGGGPSFAIGLDLSAAHDFRVGTGDIRAIARILGAAGPVPGMEHHYEIRMNPRDSTKIDIKRDNALWKTQDTPDTFTDTFKAPGIRLVSGKYTFQSELNLMDSADGRVNLNAFIQTQLTF